VTVHLTPAYGLGYIDEDTPLVQLAAASRTLAEKAEAALIRGGIAPPAAQDLATLAGRVTTTEGRVTELEGRGQAARTSSTLSTPIALTGGGAYTQVTNPGELVLAAEVGQWVQLGVSYAVDNGAGDLRVDFGSIVANGAVGSYVSGSGSTGHGVLGMGSIGGRYETSGGTIPYKLTAADFIGTATTVTFRLLLKCDASVRSVLRNGTTDILTIWGHVL